MKTTRKGIGHIRTGLAHIRAMKSRMGHSRAKTSQEALVELARLNQEQTKCCEEMAHWERRMQQIQQRLAEIDEAKECLRSLADQHMRPEQRDTPVAPTETLTPTPSNLKEIPLQY